MSISQLTPTELEDNNDALRDAAYAGRIEDTKRLLHVSDSRAKNEFGLTPLHIAAANGYTDCLKVLLPVSDAKTQTRNGMTAADLAKKAGYEDCARLIEAHLAELEGAEIAGHIKQEPTQELPKQRARSL